MKQVILFIMLMLTSCAVRWEEDVEEYYTLDGMWKTADDTEGCSTLFIIKENKYKMGRMCKMPNGYYGADVEFGSFVTVASTMEHMHLVEGIMNFTPEGSSCPIAGVVVPSSSFTYSYKEHILNLNAVELFETKDINVFFGCLYGQEFEQTNILFPVLKD